MKTRQIAFALIAAATLTTTHAKFKGSISFNSSEQQVHRNDITALLADSAQCLVEVQSDHVNFLKQYGFSRYYGTLSNFAKASRSERQSIMARSGVDPRFVDELKPVSCIGLAMKCLARGFGKVGQASLWKKINTFTRNNGSTGIALIHGLQKLGWGVAYWNEDPSKNELWDAEEKKLFPGNPLNVWGHHKARYDNLLKTGYYYHNKVDNIWTLTGMGKGGMPKVFTDLEFYVGTANTGYHVFPGTEGVNLEGHGTAEFNSKKAVEARRLMSKQWRFRSGIVAVPPGALETFVDKRYLSGAGLY